MSYDSVNYQYWVLKDDLSSYFDFIFTPDFQFGDIDQNEQSYTALWNMFYLELACNASTSNVPILKISNGDTNTFDVTLLALGFCN